MGNVVPIDLKLPTNCWYMSCRPGHHGQLISHNCVFSQKSRLNPPPLSRRCFENIGLILRKKESIWKVFELFYRYIIYYL